MTETLGSWAEADDQKCPNENAATNHAYILLARASRVNYDSGPTASALPCAEGAHLAGETVSACVGEDRLSARLAAQLGDGHPVQDRVDPPVATGVVAVAPELRVGFAQDPRQPVGKLGRDRRAVSAAGLPCAQDSLKARLDQFIAASPRQRPVVSDKAHDGLAQPDVFSAYADAVVDGVCRPPAARGRARRLKQLLGK